MDNTHPLNCDVVADLMVVYSSGKASAETRKLVETHLNSCPDCARAYGDEPVMRDVKDELDIQSNTDWPEFVTLLKLLLLKLGGFGLYLITRLLVPVDRLFENFGWSTTKAKVRIYRLRRRVAAAINAAMPEVAASVLS
jgi:hypothetical protein